ncbi:hypothetical protein QBC44DRAFT_306303 [Cladorrhinum sp. PSN332]|nr:hypothetical protein QBC44DRAFT_306303 [Cladorrhinum sp. PSN332]
MATIAERGDAKTKGPFPGFVGSVFVQGSKAKPQIPVETASKAAAFVPTLEKPEFCFFADSSCSGSHWRIGDTGIQRTGGLGIVFRRFDANNRRTPGELSRFGWALKLIISPQIGEGIAVADAITIATEELRRAVMQYGDALAPEPVVRIFTDSQSTLYLLRGYSIAAGDPDSLRKPNTKVLEMIARESRYLADIIPGIRPQLELRWLPSHIKGFEVDEHKLADAMAYIASVEQDSVHIRGRGCGQKVTPIDISSSIMIELMPDIHAYINHLHAKRNATREATSDPTSRANPTQPARAIPSAISHSSHITNKTRLVSYEERRHRAKPLGIENDTAGVHVEKVGATSQRHRQSISSLKENRVLLIAKPAVPLQRHSSAWSKENSNPTQTNKKRPRPPSNPLSSRVDTGFSTSAAPQKDKRPKLHG